MTPPMPRPTTNTTQLGALLGDYPSSPWRYAMIMFGIVLLFVGITGTVGNVEFDTTSRVIGAGLGIVCLVQFYLTRGAHAQIFERGFVIASGDSEVSGRWEDVSRVEHRVYRQYLLGLIPLPLTQSHKYIMTLTSGRKLTISRDAYSNSQQLGETILRLASPSARAAYQGAGSASVVSGASGAPSPSAASPTAPVIIAAAFSSAPAQALAEALRTHGRQAIVTTSPATYASSAAATIAIILPGQASAEVIQAVQSRPRMLIPILMDGAVLPAGPWSTAPIAFHAEAAETASAVLSLLAGR